MSSTDDLFERILIALKKQTDELKSDINNTKLEITKQLEFTQLKLNKVEITQNQLNQSILQLERTVRKNNIIIFGLNIETSDILNSVITKLNRLLDIDLIERDINNIYKLNKKKASPIKIEFVSYIRKQLIFSNIQKLKGTNVYVNNDLCKADLAENKILRHHLKEARQRGYKAHIKGSKLLINNEQFSAEQLEKDDPPSTPTSHQQSPQNQLVNSAPSTPTPISRLENIQKEFSDSIFQPPKINPNKKEIEAQLYTTDHSAAIPIKIRLRTGSTSVSTRSSAKRT